MDRSATLFLLLTCPLLACGDDSTTPVDAGTTGAEDSTSTGPVTVTIDPTMTATDTDDPDTTADSTADTTAGTDPGTTSTGESMTTEDSGSTDDSESSGSTGDTGDTGTTSGSSSGDESSSSSDGGDTCGDAAVDPGEDCDGANLDGATCTTLGMGFTDGALGCADDCTFDTSACTTCGDAVAEGAEECDTADFGGATCESLGMGFTGGDLDCAPDCTIDSSACTVIPRPAPGEVIVTEIMQNPSVLPDADGEFFELYNTTMSTLQLSGCVIEGSTDNGFTVLGDLQIPSLGFVTFATTSMVDQGFIADYQWPDADYNLTNGADTVRVVCDGAMIDEVAYDGGGAMGVFPDPNGQSMSLDPGSWDSVSNDDGANWCPGTTDYNGDFGTPGTPNPICMAPVTYNIDFCRLQAPLSIVETQGTNVEVYGRVFIAGLTDLSGVNDLAPEVFASVGYGPDGTDPEVDLGWVWDPAFGNPAYGPASPAYEMNNDEYFGVIAVPVPGEYDFAVRFSGDAGGTYTYCDGLDAGSSDGYDPANAGQMTAEGAGPPPPIYFSEYAEGSSFNKALEIYNPPGADADLTACEVRIYFGGDVVPGTTIPLAGAIAADDVLVICEDDIDPLIFDPIGCDVLSPDSFYNGDDAVELNCSGTTLDVIGQIGFDPGSEWSAGGVGTQNETIRRSCAVTSGDADGSDAFDPSVEWATFPSNTFDDFGQYICP